MREKREGKRGENEKGEWRNGRCVWWRGNIRGMERGRVWIGVWMKENEREKEKFVEDERETMGEELNFTLFQLSQKREFHKICINNGRERIV